MLKILIFKEIQESIINLRFLFTFLICLVLIPLSFYLGADEYKNRTEHIDNLEKLYIQQHNGNIRFDINAEGYRPPSPFSIFCIGLEYHLPDKVITSRNGSLQFARQWGMNNPISLLTGKIDFLYVICFILPLLIFSLTFNSISGEKENGTLRLMLSNRVPKWSIVLAKITGPYLMFSICFISGIILGVILLLFTHKGIVLNSSFINILVIITLFSMLFLFILYNIGIFISIITKNTFLSMIASLFVYVIFAMLIPKLSPMLAQVIYPVKSIQVHNTEKNILREEITRNRENEKKKLMSDLKTDYGLPLSLKELDRFPEKRKFYDEVIVQEYDKQILLIDEEYDKELTDAMDRIDEAYENELNSQKSIALNIARLSPFSSYINLVSDLSSTGFAEMENYREQAEQFDNYVKTEIYNRMALKRYYDAGGYFQRVENIGFDSDHAAVPRIGEYRYMQPSTVLLKDWPDLLLICLFAILFLAASITGFLKYDVR
jgi:ABC-type transport system involved in multi-copper enzyme maturation permease subunit